MGFVPEYEEYKEQISEFLASYILPYAEKCENRNSLIEACLKKLQEKAFWALMFPKKNTEAQSFQCCK